MYIPVITGGGKSKDQQLPGWLQLDGNEKFIRSWGSGCGGRKNRATVIASVITALTTVFAGQVGVFASLAESNDDSDRWIIAGTALVMMLVLVAVVIAVKTRGKSFQAVLTDQRMLFREKGRLSQFPLRDISRLRTADNDGEKLVQFHLRRQRGAVASLPVDDPSAVIAEIGRLAEQAGAQLG